MPIVEVNGQELEFPDDMKQEDIKAALQKKFPMQQAAPTAREPSSPLDMIPQEAKDVLARTGRIGVGIGSQTLDLPVNVFEAAYNATRGVQQATGSKVAPEINIPLPSEGAKQIYNIVTGTKARETSLDKAAEAIVPLGLTAAKIIPEAAKAALPRVEGVTKKLVQRAQQFGIPLRIDQIAPSRVTNTLQKVSQEIPFSGVDKAEEAQRVAWNKNVASTLGVDSDNLGPDTINRFLASARDKFGSILGNANILVSKGDLTKLQDIKKLAPQKVGLNDLSLVQNNIDMAMAELKAGLKAGDLTGERLANIRSDFMDTTSGASGGAKQLLGKIIDVIDDVAKRSLTPEKVKELGIARNQWRNYKTIEPLLEKSIDGNINPTDLINRVKASKYIKAHTKNVGDDDLVDLARIGKQFLVKKGGSDTFQKLLLGGGAGGFAGLAAANPVLAAQTAVGGGALIAGNRGLQSLNQSPELINAMLQERKFNPQISNMLKILNANAISNQLNQE